MPPEDLHTLVTFFKALAHESRLRLVGLIAQQERSVEKLATLLGLKTPTVSHHLASLKGVGLVTMRAEGTTHLYRLAPERLEQLSKEVLAPGALAQVTQPARPMAWADKVRGTFTDGERITQLPTSRKKRRVLLDWLVEDFGFDREYTELEVNAVLKVRHPDCATLRREMVGCGLLHRTRSIYHRPRGGATSDGPVG